MGSSSPATWTLAADGRLTLSGRGTDLIISGGLNIYPKEIELLLDEVAGVAESAVIGVPHPDLGDGVIAVVVAEPGFDTASIRVALDGRLARFKHPTSPSSTTCRATTMGKVEKAVLRARYAEQFTAVRRVQGHGRRDDRTQAARAPWESWIDRQIREAMERGDFDDLPGAGKPIPGLNEPDDEMWWVKRKLRSEGLTYLPPALALRREAERGLEEALRATSEARVRQIIEGVNEQIREANRRGAGDRVLLAPYDVDGVVERWRQRRS